MTAIPFTRQRGFTMVEMLVAVAIGLIVTAAITATFLQSRINSSQDENLARMQENARFALGLLRTELLHGDLVADFVNGGASLTGIPDMVNITGLVDCDGATSPWLFDLQDPRNRLFYLNAVADQAAAQAEYSCISNFKAGTDILALQRVIAAPTAGPLPADNGVYVRANMNTAQIFHNTGGALALTGDRYWPFIARVYYISTDGAEQSTLVRETLVAGTPPVMQSETLIDGIERFHIEFGMDGDDNDGVANYYTPDLSTSPDSVERVVTARIFVLARSPKRDKELPVEKRIYQLGSQTAGPYMDNFLRRVYTTTVMVRNFSYRAGLGDR